MKQDVVEQARVRHAADGFCRVIGCPECEVRRQERFGIRKLNVEVVDGDLIDFEVQELRHQVEDLRRSTSEAWRLHREAEEAVDTALAGWVRTEERLEAEIRAYQRLTADYTEREAEIVSLEDENAALAKELREHRFLCRVLHSS